MSKNKHKNNYSTPPFEEEETDLGRTVAIPKSEADDTDSETESFVLFQETQPQETPPQEIQPKLEPEKEIYDALPDARQNAKSEPKPVRLKPRSDRIGDLLREARLERNDDLYLIAEYLCIKPAFLIALENSRYDELPADAYVIGFLRTYATFLGIDGKEAVDRYRYEMAGRRKKPILSMPIPVSEGRTPSGYVMLGAALALILIYAVWYSISSADREDVHAPPPMPAAMQPDSNLSDSETSSAAGLTAPVSQSASPAGSSRVETTPLQSVPDKLPESVSIQTSAIIPPASPGIIVTAEKQPSGTPLKEEILDKTPAKPKTETKVEVKPEAKVEIKPEAKAEAKPEAKAEAKPAANEIKENKSEPSEAKQEAPVKPPEFSRIIIRATSSSWVMVVDNAGNSLFDRVLKAGETYKIPTKSGLLLTTGNGNGIVLSVDGNDLSPVSSTAGHMVRDIALDPDRLVAKYGR